KKSPWELSALQASFTEVSVSHLMIIFYPTLQAMIPFPFLSSLLRRSPVTGHVVLNHIPDLVQAFGQNFMETRGKGGKLRRSIRWFRSFDGRLQGVQVPQQLPALFGIILRVLRKGVLKAAEDLVNARKMCVTPVKPVLIHRIFGCRLPRRLFFGHRCEGLLQGGDMGFSG